MNSVFGCEHTPLQFPPGFDIATIPDCSSCVLRLVAPTAAASPRLLPHRLGAQFEESPLTTLYSNGIEYNCREAYLCVPAAHKLPGMGDVRNSRGDPLFCEALLYFQGILHPNKVVCLSVLCTAAPAGTAGDTTYFDALGGEGAARRTSLQSVFTKEDTFLSYVGADIRGRSADAATPRAICNPVTTPVTYYVLSRVVRIAARSYAGLVTGIQGPDYKGPPPAQPPLHPLLSTNVTRIQGLRLGDERATSAGSSGVSTAAMKCYRLDTRRDIVDGKVYVGGKGAPASTLAKELENAATDVSYAALHADGGIKPGDVERVTGIVVGVLLGLLLVAAITYYVLRGTFGRSYEKVLVQSAAAIARANGAAAAP